MLGTPFYLALDLLRVPQAARLLRRGGTVLCYHNVVSGNVGAGESASPALHMPVARFDAQVRWLARHYRVVPLRDLVARLEAGERPLNLASLTFDDGYRGTFRHAVPILLRLGLPATIFVVADAPGRWKAFPWDLGPSPSPSGPSSTTAVPQDLRPADWAMVAAAARRGIEIGSHTTTHPDLTRLSDVELRQELLRSREVIGRETGTMPDLFSYPYGRWNGTVRAAVSSSGFRAALTIDPGLNGARADPWALRRIPVPGSISGAAFRGYVAGLNPRWTLRSRRARLR